MAAEPRYVDIRPRTVRLGHSVVHVADTDSTMRLARDRAEAGAPEGLVVVAGRQTQGMGRRGRSWQSVGESLHASVLLRPGVPARTLSLLPLVAGASMARAIAHLLRIPIRLKWPNDLLSEGRKVGGILVDSVLEGSDVPKYVLVGVGVNGDARPGDFPPELRDSATSLSEAAGLHVCLPALLKLFLEALDARYAALLEGRTEREWAEARLLLSTLGRRVRVLAAEGPIEGTAVDLGPEGELLVRAEGTVHAVRSGECEHLREA